MSLNPKQEAFCREYVIDHNMTQAAIRAGYSKKTAGQIGEQNLKKLEITARVAELESAVAERNDVTVDMLIADLKEIRNRCMQRVPVMEFDKTNRTMTQATDANGEGIWEFDSNGAIRAVELMGKHIGAWSKDSRGTEEDPLVIEHRYPDADA